MASIDFGAARSEDLIPIVRHEVTRPLAQALLAKFPAATIHLYNYNWACSICLSKTVDGELYHSGWRLCGNDPHPNGEPFSYGMPDYDRFVKAIEEWLVS